jgi:hypothetical protein
MIAGGKIDFATRHTRDGHNRGSLAFFQPGHGGINQPDRTHHVDIEGLLPRRFIVADGQCAHIGHHDIQTAKIGSRLVDPGRQRGRVADVEHRAEGTHAQRREILGRLGHLVGIARTERHVGAFCRKGLHDCPTDALGAAGDQRLLAFESEIHGPAPYLR